jgi:hypothetical protein
MERNTHDIYESPTIQEIGTSDEVILGAVWMGDDIDTHSISTDLEWCDDEGGLWRQSDRN